MSTAQDLSCFFFFFISCFIFGAGWIRVIRLLIRDICSLSFKYTSSCPKYVLFLVMFLTIPNFLVLLFCYVILLLRRKQLQKFQYQKQALFISGPPYLRNLLFITVTVTGAHAKRTRSHIPALSRINPPIRNMEHPVFSYSSLSSMIFTRPIFSTRPGKSGSSLLIQPKLHDALQLHRQIELTGTDSAQLGKLEPGTTGSRL
ncbi:hypothetical protein GQ43DRAFT_36266 [Delitschia confertaspora ATCC 74209]|uniref:Uncharacterized protein n=1 Tax=Delitschia confertaspora ATCC 74209 TaxID=1513339 RepID=A0A9P4MZI4_9PLEO|nr:hypothetical protein GQ43DRAFT_36266 [Delitschia confertaspora ATCC 74209]